MRAARVILRKGIGMVHADSKPVGDSASAEVSVMYVGSLNQEARLYEVGSSL